MKNSLFPGGTSSGDAGVKTLRFLGIAAAVFRVEDDVPENNWKENKMNEW